MHDTISYTLENTLSFTTSEEGYLKEYWFQKFFLFMNELVQVVKIFHYLLVIDDYLAFCNSMLFHNYLPKWQVI